MLVFGPACGFILGSFCTKIYVDAVFIDTSKDNWVWFQIKYVNVSAVQNVDAYKLETAACSILSASCMYMCHF